MATVRLKFRASSVPSAEGTLYHQVIHKRKIRCISTNHHVFPNEWDAQTATLLVPPDGERKQQLSLMRSVIAWELRLRRETIAKFEKADPDFSLDELCEAFAQLPAAMTVFTFLQEQVLRQERMHRQGTAKTYTSTFLRFKEFRNNQDLTFDDLTPDLIEEYEAWLAHRHLKQNTIRFYLRTLNTLFRKAENAGLLANARRLFSPVRLSYVSTVKRAISESEICAIQSLSLPPNGIMAFARDMFMFSFYMRGMPFVDIAFLKKSDLKNGMVSYCRKKTNQLLTVEWEKETQEIVSRYAHLTEDSPYMLPIIRKTDRTEYRQYQRMQENINRALKKIGKRVGLKMPLTTYVARHTWATIARDMNVPITIISEGMGHHSYKTTQVYLNSIDTSRINEANRHIIRRISKGK